MFPWSKCIRLNLKLLNRIDRGNLSGCTAEVVIVIDSIDKKVVPSGTLALVERGLVEHKAVPRVWQLRQV